MPKTLVRRAAVFASNTFHRVKPDRWASREYAMPAPQVVKWSVLRRYGRMTDTWVETGTYLGDTTAMLAATARHVYSIEPGPDLAARARRRFARNAGVTIVEGLSEETLAEILEKIDGPVSIWLDGHYSEGITYQGPTDTPIRSELAIISHHLDRLGQVTVLVDDIRMFDPTLPGCAAYPPRGWLVEWAQKHDLSWTIEHDIFVAWR